MGGGSGGGTTATKSGPPKWELPYAKQLTGQAQQLFGGGPYPQQQVSPFSPDQLAAMGITEQLTPQQMAYMSQAQQANAALAGGTPQLQAGLGALQGIATGQDPSQRAAQQANLNIAQGGMLDPSKNQALQAYLQAGMDPIISNFTQAVEPSILGAAVMSGGLGSGGSQAAMGQAESELARQLGNYSAQVVEPAYQQERQLQQQAIGQQNQFAGTQIGAAGAMPGMYGPQQTAISQTPGLVAGAYTPGAQLLDVGQQQQQQLQNIYNALFQNQMMPYQMEQLGAGLVGPLAGGGGQSFQVASGPGGSMK